jgi:phosphatidate cytidylyltransferase
MSIGQSAAWSLEPQKALHGAAAWIGIDSRALQGLLAILLLLTISTALAGVLKMAVGGKTITEARLRIKTWWAIFGGVAAAALFGRDASIVALAIVSFVAFKEFMSLAPGRAVDRPAIFMAFAAIPVQYLFVWMHWYGMFIIWIPVYAFLLLPARMALKGETKGFLRAAGTMHWSLMTTVFALSHLAYLLNLPAGAHGHARWSGLTLLIFLLFLTEFNDVCQFVWGKMLGRLKALPTVSPNKTIEGFLGGVASTTAMAALLGPWMTPLNIWESLAAGLLISTAGFLGDVVMSAIKRDIGVKDSGSLLPGHGGALDRLDSLIFTAPLFFHFVYYLCF